MTWKYELHTYVYAIMYITISHHLLCTLFASYYHLRFLTPLIKLPNYIFANISMTGLSD